MAIYPMANILPDMLLLIDCNYLSNYSIASLIIERISTGQIFYLAVLRVQDVPQTDSGQTGQTIPYLRVSFFNINGVAFHKVTVKCIKNETEPSASPYFPFDFPLKVPKSDAFFCRDK